MPIRGASRGSAFSAWTVRAVCWRIVASASAPQHDAERHAVYQRAELGAALDEFVEGLHAGADDEQVARPVVEHDLRRDPGVDAREDLGGRMLMRRHLAPPVDVLVRVDHLALDETAVAFDESFQRCERCEQKRQGPDQVRMLTARAATSAMVTRDTPDWTIMVIFAHEDIGRVSVGENAVELVNDR